MNKTFSRFTFLLNRCVSTYIYNQPGKMNHQFGTRQYEVDKYLTKDKCIRVIILLETSRILSLYYVFKSLVIHFNRGNIFSSFASFEQSTSYFEFSR